MRSYLVVVSDKDPVCPGECAVECDSYNRAISLAIENLEVDPSLIEVEVWELDEFGNEDLIADNSDIASHL